MVSSLFHDLVPDKSFLTEAHSILDEMASKGNRLARVRQEEIRHLEGLFEELGRREERPNVHERDLKAADGTATAGPFAPSALEDSALDTGTGALTGSLGPPKDFARPRETHMFPEGGGFHHDDAVFHNGNSLLGLSSDDMFSLADQIGLEDGYVYSGTHHEWIWEET